MSDAHRVPARRRSDEPAQPDHVAAAEQALPEVASGGQGEDRGRAERHAQVLVQIQGEFQGHPLSEGAINRPDLVDALLAGTDALRWKADGERQAALRAPEDHRVRAEREARAAQYERQADAILELDRELF